MKISRLISLSLVVLVLALTIVSAVVPFGAESITEEASSRAPIATALSHDAIAGNVTELSIAGTSITQGWQGYFGNVSGVIQLADGSDNVMYDWQLTSPEGEVYASLNGSVDWTNIQCFNFNADGTFADDSVNRGGTSAFGMNLTQLESFYGMEFDAVDGVDETFSVDGSHESGESLTHDLFYVNNLEFHAGECLSTHVFGSSGSAEDSNFQEVILYDPTTQTPVWTSILDEEDLLGFDGVYHDFEMLVPENGFGTDLDTTTYFFYVELE